MKNLFFLWLCCVTTLAAQQNAPAPLKIGDEFTVQHATAHPYNPTGQVGVVFQQTFYNKNSMYIKLYFEDFDLAPGDYVEISTTNTGESILYAGQGKIINKEGTMISKFWSQALFDDEVTVRLHSKVKSSNYGFVISRVAYGYSEAQLEALANAKSNCGANDREDIWCYNNSIFYTRGEAVCRLIIGGSGSCTGWLLGSEGHVVTNNHCVSTAAEANNTDFVFDFEKRVCGGPSFRSGTVMASSSTVTRTNSALDYSLLDLPNNPSTTYGFLRLNPVPPAAGDLIYIIGHPSGQRKRISILSDQDPGGIARIDAVTPTRVEYFADTRPGSSGSPVLSRNNNFVVALHNTGGCPNGANASSAQLIDNIGANMPDNAVASVVTSLSFIDGFEANNNRWYNRNTDNFDWTRRSGATPSTNTGPSSAAVGNFYQHIEASAPITPIV